MKQQRASSYLDLLLHLLFVMQSDTFWTTFNILHEA